LHIQRFGSKKHVRRRGKYVDDAKDSGGWMEDGFGAVAIEKQDGWMNGAFVSIFYGKRKEVQGTRWAFR